MKRPNIIPGEWYTAPSFPGRVLTGEIVDTPRGKCANVVAVVQGTALAQHKATQKATAAVPDMLATLEDALELVKDESRFGPVEWDRLKRRIQETLVKAGYDFTQ